MKKIVALALVFVLMLGLIPAHAAEQGKYDLLTVGITTPFSGNFLDDALGSNISDQDVRNLIHGYNLVTWDAAQGSYEFNQPMVTGGTSSEDGRTYTFYLMAGMTYNDGTPITAKDYAFSLLLLGSAELQEAAGYRGNIRRILGGTDYQDGTAKGLAGFRLTSDNQFSVTIDPDYDPYFYQLKVLDVSPLPISVIAPGCTVKDDGNGAYISGPFSAELLKKTLLDPKTGYISHPSLTCGPYHLESYDGENVTLKQNEAFLGDVDGNVPSIPKIVIKVTDPQSVISDLNKGNLDLVVRCVREEQIRNGMDLIGPDFLMESYMRAGLSFISFCAEKGLTADLNVRKAVSMCMNRDRLAEEYNGEFGMPVNGYYGIGQWMFQLANGAVLKEENDKSDWSDLKITRLAGYPLDIAGAKKLLDEAGWNLNEKGNAYTAGVRYRKDGDTMVPLKLKMIWPEGNGAAALLQETFIDNLTRAGIELETEMVPWENLLKKYYRQEERDCDMILLGTNFADVFDPSGEYDENGTSIRNGITDPHLAELAIALRKTEPGEAAEYCRRWLAYLEERSSIAAEIPLYSDAYVDFHISALQEYKPAPTGSWTIAIQSAVLSDYVPEEKPEEEQSTEGTKQ